MRILIIEDNTQNAFYLSDFLSYVGHICRIMSDTNDIFDNFAIVDTFNIIILDLNLTPPMNYFEKEEKETLVGLQILKEIREISDIPVILFSAYKYSMFKDFLIQYDNVSFLSKCESSFKDLFELIDAMNK